MHWIRFRETKATGYEPAFAIGIEYFLIIFKSNLISMF